MHAFFDRYTATLTAAMLGGRKWFRESVESPSFSALVERTTLTLPEFDQEGFYELEAVTQGATLDPAFHVAQWLGPQHPTLIYHHGNNERPFSYGLASKNTFKSVVLSRRQEFAANLISLRAPFHAQSMGDYLDKLGQMENFTSMLAVSVKLVDELVKCLRDRGSGPVAVSGISLGGWVTNLHRSLCCTADRYIPILAGAALAELFITSSYRKLAADLVDQESDRVRSVLNFEQEFEQVGDANVFPLLARYDQFVVYDRQRQCYGAGPVAVMDKGHVTGTLAAGEIRSHILEHLD